MNRIVLQTKRSHKVAVNVITFLLAVSTLVPGCKLKESEVKSVSSAASLLVSTGFRDNRDGTVADAAGRIWMKCSVGQAYNARQNDCTGAGVAPGYNASTFTFCDRTGPGSCTVGSPTFAAVSSSTAGNSAAYDACAGVTVTGVQWRLPSYPELLSLTTLSDQKTMLGIFPQTPETLPFWSGTADYSTPDGTQAFAVSFGVNDFGRLNTFSTTDTILYVRCVRP